MATRKAPLPEVADKPGVFAQADGGTLFLDEFGELDPAVQVRLLRVLQEGTFVPVGGSKEIKVDIRLITATHRNLMEAVVSGDFREYLFYRVAVGVLYLPPLRERDLSLLAYSLLRSLGEQHKDWGHKKLYPDAKNLILRHLWRGNVRELQSTLLRVALWCQGEIISDEDVRLALFQMPEKETGIAEKDVSQGVDIQELPNPEQLDGKIRYFLTIKHRLARPSLQGGHGQNYFYEISELRVSTTRERIAGQPGWSGRSCTAHRSGQRPDTPAQFCNKHPDLTESILTR